MGEFSFYYPKRRLSSALARRAFVAGVGRVPASTQARVELSSETRNVLVVDADLESSGALYVPCIDSNGGFFFASTELLPSRTKPFPLFLELARGQLSRILNRSAVWSASGLAVRASLRAAISREIQRFAKLATTDEDAPNFDERCYASFCSLRGVAHSLNEQFLDKVLAARRALKEPWTTRFGFSAGIDESWTEEYDSAFFPTAGRRRAKLDGTFRTFNPRFSWKEIEKNDGVYDWSCFDATVAKAEARGLDLTFGPLIRWGEETPIWLSGRSEDLPDKFRRYVDELTRRGAGRIKRWIVASNVELDVDAPSLETRLLLAAQTASAIKRRAPDAQVFLGFEQALGDAARFDRRLCMAPIETAARIARRRVFDGFYLEINFGLTPFTTTPRDPMELHRFFDRWAALGVPLCLATSCPSATAIDATLSDAATRAFEDTNASEETYWGKFFRRSKKRGESLLTESPEDAEIPRELAWNEKSQLETARRFFSTAMSRRVVDEIIWTRWRDEPPATLSSRDGSEDFFERDVKNETSGLNESSASACALLEVDDDLGDEDEIELETTESEREEFNRVLQRNPTSGLFDVNGKPKPTLHKLSALRRAYID